MTVFMTTMASRLGVRVMELLRSAGGLAYLVANIVRELFTPPFYHRLLIEQLFSIGIQSFLLVAVTGLATGAVMALQFGHGLARFGGKLYIPIIVSVSMLREMGPVFTSLLVAGRVGSGMAAEIASMNVTQQIDAMRALGTSPIKRIVIPRVLAAAIALPILVLFANYLGLFSGMMVASGELGIPREYYIAKILENTKWFDVYTGLIKGMVFSFCISLNACWKGLTTQGGTQGVGNTTTWVVVASSISIMVMDFFLTKIFILTVYPRF